MAIKCIIFLFIALNLTSITNYVSASKSDAKNVEIGPCKACTIFARSFELGLNRTKNGSFEGGNTSWESEKLKSYNVSEIRLNDILENICSDVDGDKNRCYEIQEKHEVHIEEWWKLLAPNQQEIDIYTDLCIGTFKYCCPKDHFGPNCTPCEGFPDNICSNNGQCKGAGSRKGNGKCRCNVGYKGDKCAECNDTHFESYRDENKLLCSPCHDACDGPCSKSGATGCTKCRPGWFMEVEGAGCLDFNECTSRTAKCQHNEFCVNTPGSYKCTTCPKNCDGCTGDGPDMCTKCATDYVMVDNVCLNAQQESRKTRVFITRYLTYFGLCLATCIIFQKNNILAALIGIAVAIYITLSEYALKAGNTDPLAEQLFKA